MDYKQKYNRHGSLVDKETQPIHFGCYPCKVTIKYNYQEYPWFQKIFT